MTVENTSASQIAPVRQDRIRNPFSFFLFHYFFTTLYPIPRIVTISKSGLSLKRSLILPICTSIVCGSASVSYPHTSSINCCFVNVLPGEAASLYKSRNSFFRQNKTFLISCNRHCIIIKLC